MPPTSTSKARWRPLYPLLALSAIPVLGGLERLQELAGSPSPDGVRFAQSPLPIVVHVVASTIYCLAGALQFDALRSPALRARHRRLGWVVLGCGLSCALSGLWMTLRYPIPAALQGNLLFGARIVVSLAMASMLVLALLAIQRRCVTDHRAWMLRAYALGQGGGTQAILLLPTTLLLGEVTGIWRDLLLTLGWVVNGVAIEMGLRLSSGVGFGARSAK